MNTPFAQTGVQTHPCPTVRRALEPGRTGETGPPVPGAILPGASGVQDVQQDPLDSCTKSSGQRCPPVVPRLWPQLFVAGEGLDSWKRGARGGESGHHRGALPLVEAPAEMSWAGLMEQVQTAPVAWGQSIFGET